MSVLSKNILDQHGPYIRFSVVDNPFNEENLGKKKVFFEFADDLLGAYCNMTKSYSPFDVHFDSKFEKPYEIYEFASKLLLWELQITKAPENYFRAALEYINYSSTTIKAQINKPAQLKVDMLETLHFMIGEIHKTAALEKCLHIEGI